MKNVQFKKLISVIIFILALALFVAYFWLTLSIKKDETIAVIGFSVLGLVVTYIITTIFHELGHLIFGVICKLKFVYFKVFGFKIYSNESGKLKIALERDGSIFGETAFAPTDVEGVSTKIGLTALGGPCFSFLQTVAGLIVALTCFENTAIFCIFGLSFILPLYVFVINVIPFSHDYDGHLAFTLLFGGKKGLIASAYITAETQIAGGLTPEEVNGRLLSVYDDNYDYYSVKIIRLRYLASLNSDDETAFLELDKISDLSKLPDGTYAEVLYEQFFKAITLGDEEFIESNKEEIFEYLDEDDSPASIRVQTAYSIYLGDYERAKLLIDSGLKALKTYSNLGMAKFEQELLKGFKLMF